MERHRRGAIGSLGIAAGILTILAVGQASLLASDEADVQAVAEGSNAFACDLYGRLRSADGNLFFSPYSISAALAMTSAGARGETAGQMAKVLHLSLEPERLHPAVGRLMRELSARAADQGEELAIANALWVQAGLPIEPAFHAVMRAHYEAGFREADFLHDEPREQARLAINRWVEERTREKITELLAPDLLSKLTRMALVNAVYFKGRWRVEFAKERTREEPFMLQDGRPVEVPMMRQTAMFRYAQDDTAQALELPYAGGRLAMLILLPLDPQRFTALEEQLSAARMGRWVSTLQEREVVVEIPRFQMSSMFRLGETLQAMGMRKAFECGVGGGADFSGITADLRERLCLSHVIHKAFVDVNEEGTEAAAATAVTMGALESVDSRPEPVVFRADHPFLFAIRDARSGALVFLGRVTDPRG